ncbi:MAG: hypothetical protein QF752_11770 [Planctomycetota bacterium]|nr:hypothetical protein [Planctomycetota bacterium]
MRWVVYCLGVSGLFWSAVLAQEGPRAPVPDASWNSIFNGKNLNGWSVQPGDEGLWSVSGGELAGNNPTRNFNYFGGVRTDRQYGDMALSFELFLESGGIAVRKWRFFTVHFTENEVPLNQWVRIVFIHDGKFVLAWVDNKFMDLTQQAFEPGVKNLTLMLNKESRARIRNIRVKVVGEKKSEKSERPEKPEKAQKPSESRSAVDFEKELQRVSQHGQPQTPSKDFSGWKGNGDYSRVETSEGVVIRLGLSGGEKASLLQTGEDGWTDGTYVVQFRGLAPGETLVLLFNMDMAKRKATELQIKGDARLDPDNWTSVLVELKGDEVVAHFMGQVVRIRRQTTRGPMGFLALPGTDVELRKIYVRHSR